MQFYIENENNLDIFSKVTLEFNKLHIWTSTPAIMHSLMQGLIIIYKMENVTKKEN